MKKFIQHISILLLSITFLASCEKAEVKEVFLGGSAPVLSASASGTVPLAFATQNNLAVKFSWTNPAYQFASGVSSQDVTYLLEIDETGKNFAGANKKSISVSKDLAVQYTQKDFNIILSDLKLKLGVAASIDVGISASLGASATKLTSNTLKLNVTPFAPPPKVPLPGNGDLWVIGDAFESGWNNPLPAPFVTSQKFTKVSETLYELVVGFKGGGYYKMLQDNGVWGTQYHMVAGDAAGGTFEKKDADPAFVGPTAAGNYKIVVNFQEGTFTVNKQ
ncbi:MAG: SusE domain-containing protein [Bacteroidota bacterium]